MITLDNAKTTIDVVARLINKARSVTGHVTTSSIADVAKLTRVEPTVIVSPDCMNLEYAPAIQQSLLSLFCGYYLMAVDILGNVRNVEVVRALDKLNPNRDATGWLMSDQLRKENFQYNILPSGTQLKMEATGDSKLSLQDNVNLSVGRLLDVTFVTRDENGNDTKTNLKVQVRLMASQMPEAAIVSFLAQGGMDQTAYERFHAWRAGRLEFIRDLVLCQDMIDEKMRTAVQDQTGIGSEIHRKVATNRKFGVLTDNPSLSTASNLIVISEEIASQIEYKLGGKLTNYQTRQKMFEASYAMIVVVVNRESGRCRFFVRNQPDYATVSRKEMEAASKGGKGPDVMEIFRALQTSSFSNF